MIAFQTNNALVSTLNFVFGYIETSISIRVLFEKIENNEV